MDKEFGQDVVGLQERVFLTISLRTTTESQSNSLHDNIPQVAFT